MSTRITSRAPIWVQEKRQPRREELAAAHAAAGGGMGTSHSNGASLDLTEGETELVPLESNPNILIPRPKIEQEVERMAANSIKVRKVFK